MSDSDEQYETENPDHHFIIQCSPYCKNNDDDHDTFFTQDSEFSTVSVHGTLEEALKHYEKVEKHFAAMPIATGNTGNGSTHEIRLIQVLKKTKF